MKHAAWLTTLLLSALLLGCETSGPEFIYLPHHKRRHDAFLGAPRPSLYEYVLIRNPPPDSAGLVEGMWRYADSLDRVGNPEALNHKVYFFKLTARTDVFVHNERDPRELGRVYLDDNAQDYIGAYSASRCEEDTARRKTEIVLVESATDGAVVHQRTIVVSDGCTPAPSAR